MGEVLFLFFLILVGWIFGRTAERRHYARLQGRESANGSFLVTTLKSFPAATAGTTPGMVVAETVVATDYLKSFLANIRRLFGGEVRSYHSLLGRARREATQQLVEQAQALGHNAICNVRIQTADVGGSTASKKGAAMVAVLASATAYTYDAPTV
ncbi:YbjQ family protein [Adhaeretor mobilis]|uniref:YbjQ family protein n=1 Tax=Adhaeretor mobilis TaxID=1930276 RepID=A0A517MY47_9BACT|nr:heavy metal-binding domain-containing protein [Adhaeretor mobilis]QDS99794.1 hypothetical protein HG15A2_31250 [Adhaeretor mobilis]